MMEEMLISMLGKMTGLSPDEMKALSEKAINLLQSLEERLQAIEANQIALMKLLQEKGIENDNDNNNSNSRQLAIGSVDSGA